MYDRQTHLIIIIIIIIIIMKTIYIAPKNRMNGTLGASHINSFCTQTHTRTTHASAHTHTHTHTHYLSPSLSCIPHTLARHSAEQNRPVTGAIQRVQEIVGSFLCGCRCFAKCFVYLTCPELLRCAWSLSICNHIV